MPNYEYECLTCKHITVLSRKMSERNEETSCKSCGNNTKKILSIPNINNHKAENNRGHEAENIRENVIANADNSTPGFQFIGNGNGNVTGIELGDNLKGVKIEGCGFNNLEVGVNANKQTNLSLKSNHWNNVKDAVKRGKRED